MNAEFKMQNAKCRMQNAEMKTGASARVAAIDGIGRNRRKNAVAHLLVGGPDLRTLSRCP
jgi:hypothetical protein